MTEKTSRILLILEAVLIATPLTFLALVATYLHVSDLFKFPMLAYVIALGLLTLLSLGAIASGWRLFAAFLLGGTSELKRQHPAWWVMILAGVLILFGSFVSKLLPPSPEYSMWWSFRFDFDMFTLCAPILIPLCHLAAERVLRQTSL